MNRSPKRSMPVTKQHTRKSPPMDPALRAVLIYLIPSVILRIFSAVFGFAWVGGLLQLLLYFFCGYSAASAYYETIRRLYPKGRPTEQLRKGAASGMALGVLLTIITLLLILITGPMILSLPFLVGGVVLVCWIPYDVLAGLFIGALGGKVFSSLRR